MKRWQKRAAAILGAALAGYVFCTPVGAVRLSVAISGHPVQAISSGIESGFKHSFLDDPNISPYHMTTPAIEITTAGQLENWAVRRLGPVYVAYYWGYA